MGDVIYAADLFCGAGGTSTGLAQAAEKMGRKVNLIAVNHWDVAIETHAKNHPGAMHYCTSLDSLNPDKLVKSNRLHLLVASPECTHHSNARGGKPMCDQSRSTAWHVLDWASRLYIDNILIENVPEFMHWGPLTLKGRPMKNKRGAFFQQFIKGLQAAGYRVEYQLLTAANYGDPTTRRRLFILASRGRNQVRWPDITHLKVNDDMFSSEYKAWVPARDIIDWTFPSQSIFTRKRPLSDNTMRRIAAGIKKFWGEPFLTMLYGTNDVRSLDLPLATVTSGNHMGLVQPFLVNDRYSSGTTSRVRGIDEPTQTVTPDARMGLLQPFIVPKTSTGLPRSVERPLHTITTESRGEMLIQPFIIPKLSGGAPRSIDDPLHTITTTSTGEGIVQPFIVTSNGQPVLRSVDEPTPTITAGGGGKLGMVEPFLIQYNGTSDALPVNAPMPTLSTRERHALVQAINEGNAIIDIHYRMLQPHELAAAMSFPKDYQFAGNKSDIVKQIGNAVPVRTAEALCRALLEKAA